MQMQMPTQGMQGGPPGRPTGMGQGALGQPQMMGGGGGAQGPGRQQVITLTSSNLTFPT